MNYTVICAIVMCIWENITNKSNFKGVFNIQNSESTYVGI